MKHNSTTKKLRAGVIAVIALSVCLVITTYALVRLSVDVRENRFQTGTVKINLDDGKPIIDASDPNEEFKLFEPGMVVVKDFFVENESSDSVYYSVYMGDVQGGLANVLEITIKDGDTVLCSGTAAELTRENTTAAGELQVGERKDLKAYFYFPKETGNSAKNQTLSFTLCADATQTRNNPNKEFN